MVPKNLNKTKTLN